MRNLFREDCRIETEIEKTQKVIDTLGESIGGMIVLASIPIAIWGTVLYYVFQSAKV